jgi:hypothetical protein
LKKRRRKAVPKGKQKMKATIGARLSSSNQRLLTEFLEISGASKSLVTNAAIEEMVQSGWSGSRAGVAGSSQTPQITERTI